MRAGSVLNLPRPLDPYPVGGCSGCPSVEWSSDLTAGGGSAGPGGGVAAPSVTGGGAAGSVVGAGGLAATSSAKCCSNLRRSGLVSGSVARAPSVACCASASASSDLPCFWRRREKASSSTSRWWCVGGRSCSIAERVRWYRASASASLPSAARVWARLPISLSRSPRSIPAMCSWASSARRKRGSAPAKSARS